MYKSGLRNTTFCDFRNVEIIMQNAWILQRLPTGWMVRGLNPGGGEIFRTCPDRP